MLQRCVRFLPGFLAGLLLSGILFLLIAGPRGSPLELEPRPTQSPLSIHVAGCVLEPGVYHLPHGSIVEDAITEAGGALDDAELDRVNLAQQLEDGQRIYLPCAEETPLPEVSALEETTGNRLNINTATSAELELLPGIGPALAESIITYREEHGPFTSIDQLEDVSGIGPSKLAMIEDLIAVE